MNKEQTFKKRAYWLGFVAFWMLAGVILSSNYGIYCNMTDSFPQGYFIVKKHFLPTELHKNTIITTRVDFESPYISKGKVLIKQIACDSGDTLVTRGKEFYCNDKLIAVALEKDSQGKEIQQFEYTGVIPEGYVFLTAENPRSYDSRYFGLSAKAKVEEIGLWRF